MIWEFPVRTKCPYTESAHLYEFLFHSFTCPEIHSRENGMNFRCFKELELISNIFRLSVLSSLARHHFYHSARRDNGGCGSTKVKRKETQTITNTKWNRIWNTYARRMLQCDRADRMAAMIFVSDAGARARTHAQTHAHRRPTKCTSND